MKISWHFSFSKKGIAFEKSRNSWGIVASGLGIVKRKKKKKNACKVKPGNYFKTSCQCIYGLSEIGFDSSQILIGAKKVLQFLQV